MIVMILLYVMTMLIKLSREISVPFSDGYDTSLTDVTENDFKDTPQVNGEKRRGRDMIYVNAVIINSQH